MSIKRILFRLLRDKQKDYWGEQKYLEKNEFKYVLWMHEIYKKINTVPGHIV